ncbi:retinol dehydrogenase 11-like [Oratosquilla oratoria]|uniref:retinol dehydrogenase 11-like n=1 Tax=Oratosquilla oratoria TaxID=337810 RepID=UPI003F76C559
MEDVGPFLLKWLFQPPFSFVGWAVLFSIFSLFVRLYARRCKSRRRLDGAVVIVTGANSGIGKETTRDLAGRGATVIMACRNIEKAVLAKADLVQAGVQGDHLEVLRLDTSSMASVRKFAKEFGDRRLDILINNAGVADPPRALTEEGLEVSVATNHLGHFLLTHLLMPNLKRSKGRVIAVSSVGHLWVKSVDKLDLEGKFRFDYDRPLKMMEIYIATKMYNVLFTMELARKLEGTGVTAFSLHPGVVDTPVFRFMKSRWYAPFVSIFTYFCGKTPKEGAQTTIHVAVTEGLEEHSGAYFDNCQLAPASPLTRDPGLAKKVWEISEEQVQLQPEERTI